MLAGIFSAGTPFTPKLKWWQTLERLELDVDVRCARGLQTSLVQPGDAAGELRLSCVDKRGRDAALDFELREPVIAPSECKQLRDRVHCSLTKHHPHAYDRLAWRADALRGIASVDFDRWEDLDGAASHDYDTPGVERFDYTDDAPAVRTLDAAAFEAARASADVLVVDVAYPWCSHCDSKRRAFAAAAAALAAGDAFVFGAVNALEERELRAPLGAACMWDCTHAVFLRGEEAPTAIQARGEYEADALLRTLRAVARPLLAPVRTDEELAAYRAPNEVRPDRIDP